MKILHRLADIPSNTESALYGAGGAGSVFLSLLREFRPDLTPYAFVDSFKSGNWDGLPIIPPEELDRCITNSMVLITSMAWRKIAETLRESGIEQPLVVPPRFLTVTARPQLLSSPLSAVNNPLFSPLLKAADCDAQRSKLETVEALLGAHKHRRLYRLLTCSDRGPEARLHAIGEFYLNTDQQGQYLDFIDYRTVSTIIEGGVYDGKDTLAFLRKTGEKTHIFGFEPLPQALAQSPHQQALAVESSVEILPFGLWSSATRLSFSNRGSASRVVDQPHHGESDGALLYIETISIDQFARERGIDKVDLIKLDVEGAELEALRGAVETIKDHRPQLAVCLYHKKEDFYEIPLFLHQLLDDYRFHLGHYTAGALETVWYAIPNELLH